MAGVGDPDDPDAGGIRGERRAHASNLAPVASAQADEPQRSLQEVSGGFRGGASGGAGAAAVATFGRAPARGQNDEGSLSATHQTQGPGLLLQVVGVAQAPDPVGQPSVIGPELVQVRLQTAYSIALFEQAASGLDRHGPGESDHQDDGYDLRAGAEPGSEPANEGLHYGRANALAPA